MTHICPECNKRPVYGPKAKSCKECLPARKQRQAAQWKAEHRDAVREKDRDRYRRKAGGRDPGKTLAKAKVAAGVLPIIIQRILPGQMEAAIQGMIDRREAERFEERLRAEVHAAVLAAKGKFNKNGGRKRAP